MIDRAALLTDLQKLLTKLEADLLERSVSSDVPEVGATLRAEFARAQTAARTAQNYEDWRTDAITQHAAAWVLSAVFVRFLEDNALIAPPRIAGPGDRLQRARDEHELYFRQHPTLTDRDYLLHLFDELARLPGTRDVFGGHNPLRELPNWLSGDAAGLLLREFQKIDASTGALVHDFTDPAWDTRFLGDLYQDLSEAARKKYALLQTPEFVEEFILDRTLDPAIEEFGLVVSGPLSVVSGEEKGRTSSPTDNGQRTTDNHLRLIDPACGSGHFLLGAFRRILDRWQRREPGTNPRVLVQRALDSVHGVDVNPYAIAIARFRLLLVALRASDITRLADAPAFRLHLVCGDSLLHGVGEQQSFGWSDVDHAVYAEDLAELRRILVPGRYHAVVANPPYITPKDRVLNQAYRDRYRTCHMKYSLAVPFLERIFQLACPGGYTGQITANSFMKREFGKKLIEAFLPTIDLTHVIDTSGAYIPGHGTPTVLLFGRHRSPVAGTIRTVLGIRGEPSTPADPAHGQVWSAIVAQIDQPGTQSEFVSAGDSQRELFGKHPWSIGGGGASELKEQLEESSRESLNAKCESIGFASFTGQDEAFVADESSLKRALLPALYIKNFVVGDCVRDWSVNSDDFAFAPYAQDFEPIELALAESWARWMWPLRTAIGAVISFGGRTRLECGDKWWTWYRWVPEKYRTPLSIVFAFVATHNHFVLDRGGKVFKQSAPVIKLPPEATEDDHLALLGLLNSSTGCFWMKQVFHDKGSTVDSKGARQTTIAFENFREFTGTGLLKFPLPVDRSVTWAKTLDRLAAALAACAPQGLLVRWTARSALPSASLAAAFAETRRQWTATRQQMIAAQEELDWECYRLYGLLDSDLTLPEPPPLNLGQRAFEIVLARKMAAGETQTTWFERHGSTPITALPAEWPEDYRRLVERRIELIESDPNIRLIEQPEYKRRWNTEPWESQLERALREWLLDRLETYFDCDGRMNDAGEPTAQVEQALLSIAKLADVARQDTQFQQVGALYRDDPAFDVQRLVEELVTAESVPLLPVLRYKDSGLRKRAEWEQTWDLQRREDAGETVGTIPVPPKYTSADFLKSDFWRLRGKLDVPKERWVSFPHCDAPDGTLMIAWAGYDHLQLAQAVSAYYVDVQERLGGRDDPRLPPLLAGLAELVPWLKQWHNTPDPNFSGQQMGDYFEGFIQDEARQMGQTVAEVKAWTPPAKTGRGKKKAQ